MTKKIAVPVDGSRNSMKSLDYLDFIYHNKHNIDINLFHILPSLPWIITDEEAENEQIWTQIKYVEKKKVILAEQILSEAKIALVEKGFKEEKVRTSYHKMEVTIHKDICHWARSREADAILLGRRGRTDVKTFFLGEICDKLVECCDGSSLWIVGGRVDSKKVLVCIDASKNALRAVKHVGVMLSGTDCHVTIFHTMGHLRRFLPIAILEEAEDLIRLWGEKSEQQIDTYIEEAREILLNAGLAEEQVAVKMIDGTKSPANDILREALANNYGTVVLGRRGDSMMKELFLGSVSKKVLLHLSDLAVWIVH